jgi:exodeoxyribonuclease-3
MKIATFNINDVNKRLGNLIGWLRAEKPAVVALQELKAVDREFPKAAIEKAGYGAVWRGQKTWNGVAILARGCEPIVTRCELPGDPDVGVPANDSPMDFSAWFEAYLGSAGTRSTPATTCRASDAF